MSVLKNYSLNFLQDVRALLIEHPNLTKAHIDIEQEQRTRIQAHSVHQPVKKLCPECGKNIKSLGCRAMSCPSCGHQYMINWKKIRRFGRAI